MKKWISVLVLWAVISCVAGAEELTLKATKDSFGRSNERMRNSGASPTLYVAQSSNIRALIAFDLSGVTNKIESAVFRFQQKELNETPVTLTVAPMVQTERNAAWKEGRGVLGARGRNALEAESCYSHSAFPDIPWESAPDKPVVDLAAAQLWSKALVSGKRMEWKADVWIDIKISDAAWLEAIRTSEHPIVTFGIWGTSGKGYYTINAKESGKAPELVLTLEEEKEAEESE
ncbi:MAG: hypothetical protein JXR40_07190 [Pontiellaceae bacterium]|nr:hypothetical protein [Pontiellaceae bacterium]